MHGIIRGSCAPIWRCRCWKIRKLGIDAASLRELTSIGTKGATGLPRKERLDGSNTIHLGRNSTKKWCIVGNPFPEEVRNRKRRPLPSTHPRLVTLDIKDISKESLSFC